jgi:hypothetical protein
MFKFVVLPVLIVAALVSAWLWGAWQWSYSTGERAGWVQKLSNKGWLCKTWEGELALVSLPGSTTEKFYFTVHDDAVAQAISAPACACPPSARSSSRTAVFDAVALDLEGRRDEVVVHRPGLGHHHQAVELLVRVERGLVDGFRCAASEALELASARRRRWPSSRRRG